MMAVMLIPWALSVKPTQAGCNAFCRCPRCEKSRLGVDSSFKKATWPTPDFSSVTPSANVQSKTTAFITRAVKPVLSGGGYKAPRLLCSKLRKIRCIISTMRTYKYKLLSAKRKSSRRSRYRPPPLTPPPVRIRRTTFRLLLRRFSMFYFHSNGRYESANHVQPFDFRKSLVSVVAKI